MSWKFKSQASSARAASSFGGFGSFQTAASPLSYIAEQPDLSQISEPNVVVAFKNLGKKDSTTKAKALEDLLVNLKASDDIAVLRAWSDLYPRTAIDNSQIVRRNAHTLQGLLTRNSGKNIVPFLPKLTPSWLAGTFDNDKSVARAAAEALDETFATQAKKDALWKIYRDAIYERVEDSLLLQTATTLSDERNTSRDDAEAKYVRVVGTALRLASQLVISGNDLSDLLREKRLWDFLHHDDSYLRSAACDFLLAALSAGVSDLDWSMLSTAFVNKGLNKNHTGSFRSFLQALVKLTQVRPSIWTTDYTAEPTASKRLHQFLRQGSHNGPSEVWSLLVQLLQVIPSAAWMVTDDDADALAESYRTGVLKERLYVDAAWHSYVDVCSLLVTLLTRRDIKQRLLERHISPIITSYIYNSGDDVWKIGGKAEKTASHAAEAVLAQDEDFYDRLWCVVVDDTIEKMKLSLPESSKDFRSSQDAVAAQSKRLFILQNAASQPAKSKVHNSSLLYAAIDLLKSRNGKPYGAASIINDAAPSGQAQDPVLKAFLDNDLEPLLSSPSAEQLVLLALAHHKSIGQALLRTTQPCTYTLRGIELFFRIASESQLTEVKPQILAKLGAFNDEPSRAFTLALLSNKYLNDSALKDEILQRLVESISDVNTRQDGLTMLENIAASLGLARTVLETTYGSQIMSRLLVLADSPDTAVADRASTLTTALSSRDDVASSSLPIIRAQLSGQSEAISILTLTDLGLKSTDTLDVEELLPDAQEWDQALRPHLKRLTPSSLAITSPLLGSVWSVEPTEDAASVVVRDAEEFSLLFRIVFFVTKVLKSNPQNVGLGSGPRPDALFCYYPLALQLVNEKVTLDAANDIWLGSTDEVVTAAADVLSEGSQLVRSWLQDDRFTQAWLTRLPHIQGSCRRAYLEGLAFFNIISSLLDRDPRLALQQFEQDLLKVPSSPEIIQSAALLAAVGEHLLMSQSGVKIVNVLIADVTSAPFNFAQMVYLNILLKSSSSILDKLPQQRLVFLFQKLVNFLREEADGANLLSEGFALVSRVVPYVQNIYGEHWETLMAALSDVWEFLAADDVALLHSSLSVFGQVMRCLKAEDVNDDLVEAVAAHRAQIDTGLLHCLQALGSTTEDIDQPKTITAELLRRQLTDVRTEDSTSLFPLLGSGMPAVRISAYDLLHKTIPQAQEQLSIDLALNQKAVSLPDELMNMISNSVHSHSYMLSWKIVFDHYPKASHKLQEMYTTNLKHSGSAHGLLSFLCDKLRITSSRPLDASKFAVTVWDLDMSDSTEHDMQWLSVHLYYLTLTYIPGLAKDWFLEQKNNIKSTLESWTQKYITPHIVLSSLDTVTSWASTQSQDAEDRPMEVKASARGSEIVASIQVDPESPPISLAISLPSAYPLEPPSVMGRTRVGLSDKNFNAWLRTIQIIIFSSGSIIEGLIAFRRNVLGALKGQSECAICYSIIGTDMQTPNKKCGTCKNTFHGVCLFRWFKSSNSSTCPLCRNNFSYA